MTHLGKHTVNRQQSSSVITTPKKCTCSVIQKSRIFKSNNPMMLPVLQKYFLVFLLNMHMGGCIGKKFITKFNTEDLCPKQQLTEITPSVAATSQYGNKEFYTKFLLHFTLPPQLRKLRQTVHVLSSPHNHRSSTSYNTGNRSKDLPKSFAHLPFAPLSSSGSAV